MYYTVSFLLVMRKFSFSLRHGMTLQPRLVLNSPSFSCFSLSNTEITSMSHHKEHLSLCAWVLTNVACYKAHVPEDLDLTIICSHAQGQMFTSEAPMSNVKSNPFLFCSTELPGRLWYPHSSDKLTTCMTSPCVFNLAKERFFLSGSNVGLTWEHVLSSTAFKTIQKL